MSHLFPQKKPSRIPRISRQNPSHHLQIFGGNSHFFFKYSLPSIMTHNMQPISYPNLDSQIQQHEQEEEVELPSPLVSWINAIKATKNWIIQSCTVQGISRIGRGYVNLTTKYGAVLGIGVMAFASYKSGQMRPTTLFNALLLLSLGFEMRRFAPYLLPLVGIYAIKDRLSTPATATCSQPRCHKRVTVVERRSVW